MGKRGVRHMGEMGGGEIQYLTPPLGRLLDPLELRRRLGEHEQILSVEARLHDLRRGEMLKRLFVG